MKKTGLADSPFFRASSPPSEAPSSNPSPIPVYQKSEDTQSERISERKSERTENRSDFRTVQLPLKRRTKRYSFEFYEDQIARLKQLKIQAEMEGESLTLSDMAREALEQYLKNKP